MKIIALLALFTLLSGGVASGHNMFVGQRVNVDICALRHYLQLGDNSTGVITYDGEPVSAESSVWYWTWSDSAGSTSSEGTKLP